MQKRSSSSSRSSPVSPPGWVLDDFLGTGETNLHTHSQSGMQKVVHPPVRRSSILFAATGLALLFHVAVFFAAWRRALPFVTSFATPPAQLVEIELTPLPDISDHAAKTEEIGITPTPQTLQGFHTSAVERTTALEQTLTDALNRQDEAEAVYQQHLSSLATTRDTLSGQIASLTEEKTDLTAQLASERQRSTELKQQLQEAQQAKEQELSGMKGTYDRLVASLETEISQKEIALHQTNEKLMVTILDRVLFPSGQATLTPEGERVMEKVAAVLTKMEGQRILIEGHTDNVSISAALSARFPTNWELSTARATEVVKYLISHTQFPASRLSAVGRADTAPIADNTTEDGRRLNRRIELIVLPPENPMMGLS